MMQLLWMLQVQQSNFSGFGVVYCFQVHGLDGAVQPNIGRRCFDKSLGTLMVSLEHW